MQKIRPFAKRLREERARLELSQSQVAIAGKVSKTTQVAYEADQHVPDLEYMAEVSSLGINEVYVLTGKREEELAREYFDWDLLGEIVESIHQRAIVKKVTIPSNKLIKLARILYDEFSRSGEINAKKMSDAIELVA